MGYYIDMKKNALFAILALCLIFTACDELIDEIFDSNAAVSGVTLDQPRMDLTIGGDPERLYANVKPYNAANKGVTWKSSDSSVAAVAPTNNLCMVTGVKVGTATITVTTADGGKTATCTVTVSAVGAVTRVTLDKPTLSLSIGGTENLYPVITPPDAINQSVTWSSDKPAVATVDATGDIGTVTGMSAGTATITVTTVEGKKTATCVVTVGSTSGTTVTGVTLNKSDISLNTGYTETLLATIVPANATNQNVTWSSSNNAIATVSDGMVTGRNAGSATITVTTAQGNKTATCTVTVIADSIAEAKAVQKVSFTGTETTKTVTLNLGSTYKDIYLVKVNTSGNNVSAANTGGASGSTMSIASANIEPAPDDALIPRMGHPAADEFHANPPPFERKPQGRSVIASSVAYSVGNSKSFWVEATFTAGDFIQKQATLKAQGQYGNIWVINDLTTYTDAQAKALADKFDVIYPAETNLLGYEYGGGPSGDGGWDGDKRIQILVYDIGYSTSGTTLGYFWAKDMFKDTGSGDRSNEAEMFYLNGNPGVFTGFGADALYSTLVHEFQHMINYSQKSPKKLASETWYNEMLSMMAEDVISPLIGITSSSTRHPIKSRIPTFLTNYNLAGITEWGPNGNTLDSYSIAYAFGAYLLRNYGGASLLQAILANNSTNEASITAALNTVAGGGLSFADAFRRFGEAMIFSGTMPTDVQSFDKTFTKTIGIYTYTAAKFNVWTDYGSTKLKIFGANETVAMRPYSITVHQSSTWKNKTGTFSVTLQKPADSNIEFYIMVK